MGRKASKKRKKSDKDKACDYRIEITAWDLQYQFAVNRDRNFFRGPYMRNPGLSGRFVRLIPATLSGSFRPPFRDIIRMI